MELWREGRSPSCLSSLHHCSTVLSWLAVCSYSCEDTMQLNDSHTLSLWGVCWVKRAPEMWLKLCDFFPQNSQTKEFFSKLLQQILYLGRSGGASNGGGVCVCVGCCLSLLLWAEESSTWLNCSGKAAGGSCHGGKTLVHWGTSNKGSWHKQKCLKPFYYIQKAPNALLCGEELQDSCQSGWPLPFNLNMPKWARGFIFVLLHCLPPTHLCFPLRCLWLLLMLLSPVLASLLGRLCGLPPFLAPFPTSLMVQESFWLFLCLHFTLGRVVSDVLRW